MKTLLSLLLVAAVLSGCATARSVAIAYDDKTHGDAGYEWSPHDRGNEWWYLTGQLTEQSGKSYFYQITIFRSYLIREGIREGIYLGETYALHLSFTDPATGRHLFSEKVRLPSATVRADGRCIVFEGSRICRDGEALRIQAKSNKLRLDLEGRPTKPVVWHGRDGRIIMGHRDRPAERSYYYSYTNIATTGTLAFKNPQNEWVQLRGNGKAWFDRQWGLFSETGWEWFSLRFFDDEEIMLYAFPKTGHQEGTFVDRAGRATTFDNYRYRVKRFGRFGRFQGQKVGLGWTITVPFKDRTYQVIPLVDDQFNPSKMLPYWEGICKILDPAGRLVGYAVVETPGNAY